MLLNIFCRFLFLLINWQISTTEAQFRLYHSDRVSGSELYHDCLLYNESDPAPIAADTKGRKPSYQIIPFCIRLLDLHSNTFANNGTRVIHGISREFETLRSENVTSQQLYLSFAPIDVVERYQEFLESSNQSLSNQTYYNCSMPWFGEFCQYTFYLNLTFDKIVYEVFSTSKFPKTNGTCYTFMECDRGPLPSCLDWREICDGKIDCLDGGADERACDELDSNECTKDEYRCRNGLCIPNDFFKDDLDVPDCIDGSDEQAVPSYGRLPCRSRHAFRCEEKTCRNEYVLSCGDGDCSDSNNCHSGRHTLLLQAKLSHNANLHLSEDCWKSLICIRARYEHYTFAHSANCSARNLSERHIQENCPPFFFFPAQSIAQGHVRFAYANNLAIKYSSNGYLLPHYVCYDQQLCESLPSTVRMNDSDCRSLSELNLDKPWGFQETLEVRTLKLFLTCSTSKNSYIQCPTSKPFRCANSTKCLALNRLLDGFPDCFEGDDEQIKNSCSLPDVRYRFRCSSENKCFLWNSLDYRLSNGRCIGGEDVERDLYGNYKTSYFLSFQLLCNGFVDHEMLDGLNYTDEMDCEHWVCNNAYTRCDSVGAWNCPDGADEANCSSNPCAADSHPCILPYSYNFTCLPLNRSNDGHVDCLGAYDERDPCPYATTGQPMIYRCFNERKCLFIQEICDSKTNNCVAGDDEGEWCVRRSDLSQMSPILAVSPLILSSSANFYIRRLQPRFQKPIVVQFKLANHLNYPTATSDITTVNFNATIPAEIARPDGSIYNWNEHSIVDEFAGFCHRGIPIYSNDLREKSCLCPPSYFGYRCEYQSQRVSLTLQFRTVEWQTVFTVAMMLIDNDTNINSYEQIDYISMRDCQKKNRIYLLYLTRPKYHNRTYYVRIDVYDKAKMKYYASMLYPIRFPFLPVHRLSLQVNIPLRESVTISKNCPLKCMYGQCTRFVNMDTFFCRCFNGSSGILCTVKDDCHCSSDSICVGIINYRSICVCPFNKFGPRCYLEKTICSSSPCYNRGRCITTDEKISGSRYFCVCSEGFIGSRCENTEMKIEFLFARSILIPQSMIIHFIDVPPMFHTTGISPTEPTQTTMISKIGFDQVSTHVFYGKTFHLIFVEFNQDYYLAILRHNYTSFVSISTTIIPEHRCAPISELLDIQMQAFPTWRRAKHYHIPCQRRSDLACFYDNKDFMCLCDVDGHANCFKFDYRRVHDCLGYNYCGDDGQCYQNHNTCPTSLVCFCTKCYYGTRCQFTSTGYGLSLDGILGYSIWPNIPFSRQPISVKVSTAFTVIMFILAMINSTLSIITFRTTRSLQVGCGLYLLASSITSSLVMTMFTLKFLLLVLSQMAIITNHSFLVFNCIIMDMFLKSLVAIADWLNACVAVERTFTIHTGVAFNKKKSKKIAKCIILGVCICIFASYIHDPVHRHLLEDNEEQRKWCVVRYSSSMKAFSSFINIIHFLVPLSINVITVLFIIILLARQKLKVGGQKTHREHLWKQFHQHKHRLISSFILIIIAIPRLVISFLSECMKSVRNPWLYLGGYFVSFVSPLLVFVLFVLPSEFYRKEFHEATIRIKTIIQRRFRRQ